MNHSMNDCNWPVKLGLLRLRYSGKRSQTEYMPAYTTGPGAQEVVRFTTRRTACPPTYQSQISNVVGYMIEQTQDEITEHTNE